MNATFSGRVCGKLAERVGERRMPGALDDEPGTLLDERRGRVGEQVEALLRVQPADHADDRPGVARVHPVARQQVLATGRLAGEVAALVRRGEDRIVGGIPERGVQPVEDAEEPVAT